VSANASYRSLEGPIFGDRVGIYHASSEAGPFTKAENECSGSEDPFKMILYKAKDNYETEDDVAEIKTLPRKARRDIVIKLGKGQRQKSAGIYPQLDAIPEGEESDPAQPPEAKRLRVEQSDRDLPFDSSRVSQPLPEERIADDPNADPIDDGLDFGKADEQFRPTSQQIKDLKIAHDNCGHPTNRDFARMIKLGNGKPEIARWVAQHF